MADSSTYKSIFKATSLFGGVQIVQILVSVLRTKIIAIILGATGVGLIGLFTSGIAILQKLTSMGLASSAVKFVAESHNIGDKKNISDILSTLRCLTWLTGILGMISVVIFSPLLSLTAFGNYKYVCEFAILSITLLVDQLCASQKVVMQGLRALSALSKSAIIGSVLSLLLTIPIFILLGESGIIPSLIATSAVLLFATHLYSKKLMPTTNRISIKEAYMKGKGMLSMGIAMSISGILVYFFSFALRGIIRNVGGLEIVGFYVAGFTIIEAYVGMVFTAMSTDYYPRLAAVNTDNYQCRKIINQQGEIATLILSPFLICFIIFMPFIIRILYSEEFLPSNDYMIHAIIGMMFKLGSWIISFQFIAKGEAKLFILTEIIANVSRFILSIGGYFLYGLQGLGIGFTVSYLFYFFLVYLISRNKYSFSFTKDFLKLYFIQLIFVTVCYTIVLVQSGSVATFVAGAILTCSMFYSISGLNERMGLLSFLRFKKDGE